MNLRTRIAAGSTAATMVSLFGIAAAPANAASLASHRDQHQMTAVVAAAKSGATMLPVTGTLGDHPFTGQMSNLSASVVNGAVMLSGSLKGTGLPDAGTMFTTAIDSMAAVDPTETTPALAAPVDSQASACTILALGISNLHLNLLGFGHPRPASQPHYRWHPRAQLAARQRAVHARGRNPRASAASTGCCAGAQPVFHGRRPVTGMASRVGG